VKVAGNPKPLLRATDKLCRLFHAAGTAEPPRFDFGIIGQSVAMTRSNLTGM